MKHISQKPAKALKLPIYLDYQATTPVDPQVLETMLPYFTEKCGNPHSSSHPYGWEAEEAVEIAREHLADVIGASPKEIIFTSGATESNNLAIKGIARFYAKHGGNEKNHIITVSTEHKCVLECCRSLEQEGFNVTYLPVQPNGLLDIDKLRAAITEQTLLVSVMAVNNEIGVIQPLKEIGALCKEKEVFFHTDAAQGFGKVPLDVQDMHIDMMSISGHKIYGSKGIGALYIRRRPRIRLEPLFSGGGQERGLRSGTLPTPLVVGLGEAARIAKHSMQEENERIHTLSALFIKGISNLQGVTINGDTTQRIAGNINISFTGVESSSLILAMKDLAVSSGSACASASLEPSYVLRALGLNEETARTSIRFGIGRFTTAEEIHYAVDIIMQNVEKLRKSKSSD